ncbi:universal stress protein [Myceligenerans pegani]|uniref:Universal stress protein n=1 Tax=Myceligenerans pegani TaxID=2776917 RepID=A0ABR9N3G8_9MICO|nr:universal stress protein [Myceligenerans sp. TRM 65318]MBE1877674.1 universal stress protein [Myceligenerans sp. TRM 65318]MBE3019945.1 universal stress protein [Myceligenerans sp. TRM 65318]
MNGHSTDGHIVVGVDGSPDSVVALDWATTEAQIRETSLLVVYGLHTSVTVGPLGGTTVVPAADDLRQAAEEVLADAGRRVDERAPGVRLDTHLALLPPGDALLEAARDGAGLLVVGTRGLGTAAAIAMGSVSGQVVPHAPCPTVVVPSPEDVPPDDGSIVVGVDGSEHGDAALRFALREAARRSARLVAIHAYRAEAPTLPFFDPGHTEVAVEAEHQHAQAETRAESSVSQLVARAAADVGAAGPEPDVTVRVAEGRAGDVLVELSRDAALTVVGTRGRGEIRAALLGSVSHTVVSHARHPVAVVRADAA